MGTGMRATASNDKVAIVLDPLRKNEKAPIVALQIQSSASALYRISEPVDHGPHVLSIFFPVLIPICQMCLEHRSHDLQDYFVAHCDFDILLVSKKV
jgi:hypothetical protein